MVDRLPEFQGPKYAGSFRRGDFADFHQRAPVANPRGGRRGGRLGCNCRSARTARRIPEIIGRQASRPRWACTLIGCAAYGRPAPCKLTVRCIFRFS